MLMMRDDGQGLLSSEDYVYDKSTSLLTLHRQSMTKFSADCHHHSNQNGDDDKRRQRKHDCHSMKPDSWTLDCIEAPYLSVC